ncbi:hypothetical protein C8Q76DRAFT_699143 [Earliella scabrosa]|nr:hypothetical protein C8Q76DRAFT_699143 [Earliella scabrosa]
MAVINERSAIAGVSPHFPKSHSTGGLLVLLSVAQHAWPATASRTTCALRSTRPPTEQSGGHCNEIESGQIHDSLQIESPRPGPGAVAPSFSPLLNFYVSSATIPSSTATLLSLIYTPSRCNVQSSTPSIAGGSDGPPEAVARRHIRDIGTGRSLHLPNPPLAPPHGRHSQRAAGGRTTQQRPYRTGLAARMELMHSGFFSFSPIDRRGVCDRATGRAARASRPDRAGQAGSARARLERDKFEGGLAQTSLDRGVARPGRQPPPTSATESIATDDGDTTSSTHVVALPKPLGYWSGGVPLARGQPTLLGDVGRLPARARDDTLAATGDSKLLVRRVGVHDLNVMEIRLDKKRLALSLEGLLEASDSELRIAQPVRPRALVVPKIKTLHSKASAHLSGGRSTIDMATTVRTAATRTCQMIILKPIPPTA